MANKKKSKKKKTKKINNLVAKYANEFNKPAVHKDRKNDYTRAPKHRKQEDDNDS